MKIRLVSDLHIKLNSDLLSRDLLNAKPYDLQFGFENKINDTDIVLIAGDIGASYEEESSYLEKLQNKIKGNTKVFVVCGNHLGYDGKDIKERYIDNLKQDFGSNPFYLENDFVDLDNGYIIVGCCLYTDFKLYNDQEFGMNISQSFINDFKYIKTKHGSVNPVNYLEDFNNSVKYLDDICNKFKHKKIIVLTHFLPTPKLISSKYVANVLNPFFCSNLEEFIKEHDNIVFWGCGHSHVAKQCKIGNTQLALVPYGYFAESQIEPEKYMGGVFEV